MLNLVHPSLLHQHFTLFYALLLPLVFSSGLIDVKTGCPTRCGNLSMPFPFGVGSDCSLHRSFDLICNTSTDPPKAYLSMSGSEVEVIEIYPSQIRVNYPNLLARACYNSTSSNLTGINEWFNVSRLGTQYTFSGENWITAIGCDDLALIGFGEGKETFLSGCASYCGNATDQRDVGFCPDQANFFSADNGNGCCRTTIPRGTVTLGAQLADLKGTWRRERLFPCSYAFIQERERGNQSQFRYTLSYLNNSTAFANHDDDMGFGWKTSEPLMVRLDWRIGAENCSQARQNSTAFACRENSDCIDYFDGIGSIGGYLCNCSQGYKGNPYLTGGCQDIDECADSTINPCDSNSNCTNTPGNVTCSCLKGYYGDGRKNGTGCNRVPQSKMINTVLIGLGSGLGVLLLLSMCFWLRKVLQKRKNRKRKEELFKHVLFQQQANEGTFANTKLFSAKELEKATDHFNKSRILGQGGQGIVYKGMLSDGMIVAIKKLKLVDEDQLEQFINEVVILSQINHRNVVKLLGCCLATEVPLLVYEFVPNGTLFDLIHDHNIEFPFTWNMRLKIAADVAGALAYLHSASSIPIYHRDIKPSNILLDEKYIVKVSDFGTSRSVAVDQTHLTTMVKGTFGYLDPEYFQTSQFTEKSDVYSFGVVLVELLTGQRPISLNRSDEERSLATRFIASMEANDLDWILDAQVSKQGREEEVIAVAKLAQRCLNFKGKMRPTMKEVATELESIRISQMSSSTVEYEETRAYEAKHLMISDNEYTWTTSTSGSNVASSSSDKHPLIFEIV